LTTAAPPLARYKLLDLSRQLPGPFCSTVLGDLGMEVLVVTNPKDPFGTGIGFLTRNKRHMTLNLKTHAGREIFHRLAQDADVVLEGFRPGVTERLGVDYGTLAEKNPRLVYAAITGYGQDGPYRDRVGHDANYLGYAGVLDHIGERGGPPVIPGVQIADIGGGALMCAIGILSALIARDVTGRGQMVDMSMLDGAMFWNVYHTLLHQLQGRAPGRGETQLTGHHPCYAVYQTKDDRWVTVGAYEDYFWATFCRHFGREDFIPHQWDEGAKREEMMAFFQAAFRAKTLDEWRTELAEVEFCFGPVNTLEEAFVDPQIRHRGMVVELGGIPSPVLGPPIKLSATPASIRTRPFQFGEHTDQVLASLGYDADGIARLRADGVV
jgi:crotonobetainyl-CoA:carnitine CoA-transferase CaiB-like acyl-CoA transferase